MRLTFTATRASFKADEYALVCGVAGPDASGAEHYLTLQRDAEDAEDDWGVHLEYDDQGNGDYCCVGTCQLSAGELTIDLVKEPGGLEGVNGFDVRLDVDEQSFEALAEGLLQIFRGIPDTLRVSRTD